MARALQVGLLSLLTLLAMLVLAMMWISPRWGTYRPAPIDYPDPGAVAGWESAGWEPLTIGSKDPPRAVSGAVYRYHHGDTVLQAEVRYLDRATADVASYARRLTGRTGEGEVRGVPGGGYHRIQMDEGTVWLDACLDAKGNATVTREQFAANRRLDPRTFRRMVLWILARQPLEDRSCLWVHLSIPVGSMTENEARQMIESFWAVWRGTWQGRLTSTP